MLTTTVTTATAFGMTAIIKIPTVRYFAVFCLGFSRSISARTSAEIFARWRAANASAVFSALALAKMLHLVRVRVRVRIRS